MNLIIDIGNTVAKIAVFKDKDIVEILYDSNQTLECLSDICAKYAVEKAIVATVIDLNERVLAQLKSLPVSLLWLNEKTLLPVENLYETPETLGYDRMAAVVGAYEQFPGKDILVIDAGTCITYEFIDAAGRYHGGNISPGVQMRFRALHEFTGRLPLVLREGRRLPLGSDTDTAMREGVLKGMEYEISGYITVMKQTLTVGVGAPCKELSGMARSAAEARTALEYRSMVGRGQVIYIGDLEPDGGQVLTFEEADERTLTAAVRLGSEQEVRDAAAALAGKIREANPSAGQYNLFLMELVTHLMKMTRRSGVGVEEVFGTGFSLPIQDSALPSLEELEDWCAERYLRLRTLIRRRQTDSAGQTVETAKEYIRQHYAESDLSVEKLCAYLHLSSTYFSTLFKRETGTSFTAYVTTVRMEAAAEAIRGTEEKTYLIAQRCGYEDPNYFSYVFKRHFGVTPTKYRSEGK